MFRLRHKLTPRTTTKGTGMHYRVGCWQETLVGKMRGKFLFHRGRRRSARVKNNERNYQGEERHFERFLRRCVLAA